MKFLLCHIVILTIVSCSSAVPIGDQLETTTIPNADDEKTVTKRHILRNINQNMFRTPFANRPFLNLFNNNNNNGGAINQPNRPFFGLFNAFGNGNRPFLSALQGSQAQAAQGQAIPALQDEVQGLGVPQDLQTVQSAQNMPAVQGFPGFQGLHGLQGFHPFQAFQSQQQLQGMHQGITGPFGGGFFSHLPFAMGNHQRFPMLGGNGFPMPTYTVLARQQPEFGSDFGDGLEQYYNGAGGDAIPFAPTGYNNY